MRSSERCLNAYEFDFMVLVRTIGSAVAAQTDFKKAAKRLISMLPILIGLHFSRAGAALSRLGAVARDPRPDRHWNRRWPSR